MTGLGLLGVALALSGPAQAVDVYVNGVRADGLREVELEGVDVRFAPNGDIWIEAPGYRVEVESDAVAEPPPASASPPSAPSASGEGVPPARYWLVTEDNGSKGLVIDIIVNGRAAAKVKSGQPQTILDLGPWLRPGANTVIVNALQDRTAGGGIYYVYIGEGSNESGTLMMDRPEITFAHRAADADPGGARTSRSFQLTVP